MSEPMDEQCEQQKNDDLRWLALLIRQGLKVIVVGIEQRYGLRQETKREREARSAHSSDMIRVTE